MSDIIERLHGPDGMEAGREILRLREENARLREKLRYWTETYRYSPADDEPPAAAAIREGGKDE